MIVKQVRFLIHYLRNFDRHKSASIIAKSRSILRKRLIANTEMKIRISLSKLTRNFLHSPDAFEEKKMAENF